MTAQELETVVSYVKDRLPELSAVMPTDYFNLAERIVRVEEGTLRVEEAIKNQNLLMDKRFEAVIHQMDKRFEAIDKRFEDLIHQIDKRFEDLTHQMDTRFEAMDKRLEAIDKRFEAVIHQIDKRFEDMHHQMDKRFEAIDKRFEDMTHQMDKRFEQIAKQAAHHFGWTIGIMSVLFLGLGALITVYQVLGSGG